MRIDVKEKIFDFILGRLFASLPCISLILYSNSMGWNVKTSKVVSVGMTLVTGVLMLSFQNCGRLNIDVADLAATANKAGGSAADLARDDVKVQIIETSGDVVNVVETIPVIDDAGIITVDIRTDQDVVTEIKDQNNNQNSNQSENQSDQGQQASDSNKR